MATTDLSAYSQLAGDSGRVAQRAHAQRDIDTFSNEVDDAIIEKHVNVEQRMFGEEFRQTRNDHKPGKGCCRRYPEPTR